MIIAHLFVDEDPMRRVQLEMVPRVGDEWCHGAQRVNIGLLREES